MKISDNIISKANNNVDTEAALTDWPEAYYSETDPSKRLKMLEASIAAGIDPEADAIRLELFHRRYEPNSNSDNGYADNFMRCFMRFTFLARNVPGPFGKSRARKQVLKNIDDLGLGPGAELDELHEQILYDEFIHAGRIYISLSVDSKQYTSVIFGIGKMSDRAVTKKLYNDLSSAGIEVADMFGIHKEMELWIKGLDAARARMLPGTEPFRTSPEE